MIKRMDFLTMLILLSVLNTATYGSPTKLRCGPMKQGVWYDGDAGSAIENTKTADDCQKLCENDAVCYGWKYRDSSNSCWLQTSLGTEYTDSLYAAGSCLGPQAKQTCTEVLTGTYYSGNWGPQIKNVATYTDCMLKCNNDPECLGWMHRASDKICWTETTVYGKVTDAQYTGGTCVKPQAPYPIISIENYRQQALDKHNFYRSKHCAPSLTLDPKLNDIAQAYAEKLAVVDKFSHSSGKFNGESMGENLYAFSRPSLYTKGDEAVTSWYNETSKYSWNKPVFSDDTGHFTQLIWKGTTRLGVGRAVSKSNWTYIVANYFPIGNVENSFTAHVNKLC